MASYPTRINVDPSIAFALSAACAVLDAARYTARAALELDEAAEKAFYVALGSIPELCVTAFSCCRMSLGVTTDGSKPKPPNGPATSNAACPSTQRSSHDPLRTVESPFTHASGPRDAFAAATPMAHRTQRLDSVSQPFSTPARALVASRRRRNSASH
eukprot:848050-Pleurochrysis_carterae.AAC.1